MVKIEENNLLTYAIENGIINLSHIQMQVEMKQRKELLAMHQYKKWLGTDGKWRTYVFDSTKNNNRRIIKRNSEKELDDFLVGFYKSEDSDMTFKKCYEKWRTVQDHLIADNSIYKYNTDYKRFFLNQEIENMRVKDITEDFLKVYFHDTIVLKSLNKRAFKHMYGYVSNTLTQACKDKIIKENPMQYFECKQFYKYCKESEKTLEDKIIIKKDLDKILKRLHEDINHKPEYMPNYAVKLAYLTGMRVGEISALEWKNINAEQGYFLIDKSEKYNRMTKEYFIETTKNKKKRIFPLDDDLIILFKEIWMVQQKYGFKSEYVFFGYNGRVHAGIISSCLKRKCKSVGVDCKGIHAFRRTLNSKMRCNGVPDVVAASLLGHSPQVNRDYYTFDISSLLEKKDIISAVHTG